MQTQLAAPSAMVAGLLGNQRGRTHRVKLASPLADTRDAEFANSVPMRLGCAAESLEAFAVVADALGILTMESAAFQNEVKAKRLAAMGLSRSDIEGSLAERARCRAAKDWAAADRIRIELEERGIVVMDMPDGVEWRIRLRDASAEAEEDAEA